LIRLVGARLARGWREPGARLLREDDARSCSRLRGRRGYGLSAGLAPPRGEERGEGEVRSAGEGKVRSEVRVR
jgi:hypothetical protein